MLKFIEFIVEQALVIGGVCVLAILLVATIVVRRAHLRGDLKNPDSYRMGGPMMRRDGSVYSRPVIREDVLRPHQED